MRFLNTSGLPAGGSKPNAVSCTSGSKLFLCFCFFSLTVLRFCFFSMPVVCFLQSPVSSCFICFLIKYFSFSSSTEELLLPVPKQRFVPFCSMIIFFSCTGSSTKRFVKLSDTISVSLLSHWFSLLVTALIAFINFCHESPSSTFSKFFNVNIFDFPNFSRFNKETRSSFAVRCGILCKSLILRDCGLQRGSELSGLERMAPLQIASDFPQMPRPQG
ncbi:Uncharacterized protein TCM_025726 [Theobroma cacao]|uniref:Uncharacterized protein n=1 Tax=Theobroma cacao TaxID=3641 RepID=A0A061F759_THECC|nr:Uncharacterized protein TCM_025726 [Theobroma cacao]